MPGSILWSCSDLASWNDRNGPIPKTGAARVGYAGVSRVTNGTGRSVQDNNADKSFIGSFTNISQGKLEIFEMPVLAIPAESGIEFRTNAIVGSTEELLIDCIPLDKRLNSQPGGRQDHHHIPMNVMEARGAALLSIALDPEPVIVYRSR